MRSSLLSLRSPSALPNPLSTARQYILPIWQLFQSYHHLAPRCPSSLPNRRKPNARRHTRKCPLERILGAPSRCDGATQERRWSSSGSELCLLESAWHSSLPHASTVLTLRAAAGGAECVVCERFAGERGRIRRGEFDPSPLCRIRAQLIVLAQLQGCLESALRKFKILARPMSSTGEAMDVDGYLFLFRSEAGISDSSSAAAPRRTACLILSSSLFTAKSSSPSTPLPVSGIGLRMFYEILCVRSLLLLRELADSKPQWVPQDFTDRLLREPDDLNAILSGMATDYAAHRAISSALQVVRCLELLPPSPQSR